MKWFEIWFEYTETIIETMIRNMNDDLKAGYSPNGQCIRYQREQIAEKQAARDSQLDVFKEMDDARVNRWCYYDLKKRGVIA